MIAWRYGIPLPAINSIYHSLAALIRKIYRVQHLKRNSISPRAHVLFFISELDLDFYSFFFSFAQSNREEFITTASSIACIRRVMVHAGRC